MLTTKPALCGLFAYLALLQFISGIATYHPGGQNLFTDSEQEQRGT